MSTPRRDNRRFQRRSAVYTCGQCGRKTRETGQGESSVGLCKVCHEESGMENYHSDEGHSGYLADCEYCMTGMSQEAQDQARAEKARMERATDPLQHDYSGLDFNKP